MNSPLYGVLVTALAYSSTVRGLEKPVLALDEDSIVKKVAGLAGAASLVCDRVDGGGEGRLTLALGIFGGGSVAGCAAFALDGVCLVGILALVAVVTGQV